MHIKSTLSGYLGKSKFFLEGVRKAYAESLFAKRNSFLRAGEEKSITAAHPEH